MQFIDSHIHLQDDKIKNAQQIIAEMQKLGFVKVVCVSARESDWEQVAQIAENNLDFIIPAFGVHPWYIDEITPDWQKRLEELLKKYPQAWIGECGLDRLKAPSWKGQEEIFYYQTELAKKYNRPLNIHLLKAENEFQKYLSKLPPKFVLHSFSGSINFLNKVIACGGYISLSKASFKRKLINDIITEAPISQILTESDFPYQSSYSDIPDIVEEIVRIKKVMPQQARTAINQNFFAINERNG
ncbi:MAG: TatD family hydrolase [Alphaproteobacteria bacterium]|nr:TatD family hydrolase [Alphaproteobacteria bacterium]